MTCILPAVRIDCLPALADMHTLTRLRTIELRLSDKFEVSDISDNLHKISSTCSLHYIFIWDDLRGIKKMIYESLPTSKSKSALFEVNSPSLLLKENFNPFQALLNSIDDLPSTSKVTSKVTVCTASNMIKRNYQAIFTELLRMAVPRLVVDYPTCESVQLGPCEIQYSYTLTDPIATNSAQRRGHIWPF